MQPREAEKLVGDLVRRYPGRDLPDSSVDIFIRTALSFTFEEGQRAVERVARHSPMFLPSWAQWEQALLAESHDRREDERRSRRALPPPGRGPGQSAYLSADELAEKAKELRERFGDFGAVPEDVEKPAESPESTEEGLRKETLGLQPNTPGDGDFCSCGGVFVPGEKGRACFLCGRAEELREPAKVGKEGGT